MGICGDVNGDGKVNTGDVTLLLNHISDPEKYPLDEWAGDVNGDGVIDIGDVTLLLNHISDPEMFPLHCRAEKKGIPIEIIVGAGAAICAGIIYWVKSKKL